MEVSWKISDKRSFHPKTESWTGTQDNIRCRFSNDRLLQGPDLINIPIGGWLCVRKNDIAMACDIAMMFHQFQMAVPRGTGQREYRGGNEFQFVDGEMLLTVSIMC